MNVAFLERLIGMRHTLTILPNPKCKYSKALVSNECIETSLRDLSLTYARDKKASIDGAKALFDGEGMNDTKPCKGADGAASPVLVKSRRDSTKNIMS